MEVLLYYLYPIFYLSYNTQISQYFYCSASLHFSIVWELSAVVVVIAAEAEAIQKKLIFIQITFSSASPFRKQTEQEALKIKISTQYSAI